MNFNNGLEIFSNNGVQQMTEIGFLPFLIVFALSLLTSVFISFLYLSFSEAKSTGSNIHRSFPLLGVSITSIFTSLQFSIPLSLGLLGALSIVRFRTPIKSPEEIGFLLLVIASSLACATFNLQLLGILLFISLLGLSILKSGKKLIFKTDNTGFFTIELPIESYNQNADLLSLLFEDKDLNLDVDSFIENETSMIINGGFKKTSIEKMNKIRVKIKDIDNQTQLNFFYSSSYTK